jgi:hypothetical protein
MNADIRIQLLTLAHGERLIRLEDDATGLSVERKVHPEKPLVAQKVSLMKIFEAVLQSEHAAAVN